MQSEKVDAQTMTTAADTKVTPLRGQVPCPQCKKTSQRATYPFCSKRCADLDLGAWLNGSYRFSGPLDSDDSVGSDSGEK